MPLFLATLGNPAPSVLRELGPLVFYFTLVTPEPRTAPGLYELFTKHLLDE